MGDPNTAHDAEQDDSLEQALPEAPAAEPITAAPSPEAPAPEAPAAEPLAAAPSPELADAEVMLADLSAEPDYPPPGSVPLPPPPVSLRVYAPPVVEEIAPTSGSLIGGTKITISGANLFRATIVRVGGVIAQTIGANEPRELRVLAPESAQAGEVDVTIENPYVAPAVMAKAFRYEPLAAPRITSVAPDHVATKGGTEITVNGEHFVKTTVVLLDGKPIEGARFVGPTAIDVKVPPGEDGHMVDVSVKNPDGQTAIARRAFVHDKRY